MRDAITTPELFRLLSLSIGKENPATPYMVAKVFGVSAGTAGGWMKGHQVMDEANAEKAAAMLGLELEYVILSLEAEKKAARGMDKIAAIFARAASAVTHAGQAAAVAVLAVLVLSSVPSPALAAARLCILCKTRSLPFGPRPRRPARRNPSPSVVPALVPA